jgi:hypothetical protein
MRRAVLSFTVEVRRRPRLPIISIPGEVLALITEAGVKSVVMTDRIIGCPHEEGIDYEGATCPACPFWAGRDRWTGKRLH